MITSVALFLLGSTVRWLIYTGLLWGMIKIQKLPYSVPGLFASSLLATLVNLIPIVGPYISHPILLVCIWKCTKAELAPDIFFTVGIAGSLMFCANLWILGAALGNLRPDLAIHAKSVPGGDVDDSEDEADVPKPFVVAKPIQTPASKKAGGAPHDPVPLSLKGLAVKPTGALAMIFDGRQIHTIRTGEVFSVKTPHGLAQFRCDDITPYGAVVTTEEGEQLELESN